MKLIRSMIETDRDKILQLITSSNTFHDKETVVAMEIVDFVISHPLNPDYTILCHSFDSFKTISGYVCFGPIPLTESSYDMYWICVHKDYARQGVGSELIFYMEESIMQMGGRRTYIETSSTPPYQAARNFYERNQYQVDSVQTDFYQNGADRIIYKKDLLHSAQEKRRSAA